ncbi:T9SS type A sorting domain-containing protein [Kaistella sp. G5-32]|uniref:T9SS type A sorting domain-containing protein n=1 Tax=Kaistella gelatinilytica TaxID=2787636 RepID=A0ABS0F8C3_9FLAO|nr:T9SS type A sorting domain-containing protein [Kaistella gelatinilytica]MBF8455950.1 T9SS type A sorting domain-containing protein [Kaistella gelatinilytica]
MKKKLFSTLLITFLGINLMFSQYKIPSCSFNSAADVNNWAIYPTTVNKTWFNGGCVAMFVNNLYNTIPVTILSPIFTISGSGTYTLTIGYAVIYSITPALFELVNDTTNMVMATSSVTTTTGVCTSWPNSKINKQDYIGLAPGNYRLRVTIPTASQFFIESVRSSIDYSLLSNVETETNSKITLYPNPTKDKIFIKDVENITGIKIYNSEGKLVKESKTTSDIMNVSSLPKALYIMEITTSDKSYKTKFIKE